jgi:hypothetical protein
MILLVNAVDFARSHSSFFWKSKIEDFSLVFEGDTHESLA